MNYLMVAHQAVVLDRFGAQLAVLPINPVALVFVAGRYLWIFVLKYNVALVSAQMLGEMVGVVVLARAYAAKVLAPDK